MGATVVELAVGVSVDGAKVIGAVGSTVGEPNDGLSVVGIRVAEPHSLPQKPISNVTCWFGNETDFAEAIKIAYVTSYLSGI